MIAPSSLPGVPPVPSDTTAALEGSIDDGVDVLPAPGIDEILQAETERAGSAWAVDAIEEGAVGRTMFDSPNSRDNTVTVLLPAETMASTPSQALLRIRSRNHDSGGEGRVYLGAVVEGPFAEPDGLRADAPIVVTTTVRGAHFLPRYHGRVQVSILGEEVEGVLEPPRYRPLPNSPAFALGEEETRKFLGLVHEPAVELGRAVGFANLAVQVPANRKSVLPRHLGVLGTTGGGKSTTVSALVAEFARNGMATILIDTEGEYTEVGKPTEDPTMLHVLRRLGQEPHGVGTVQVRHLVARATTAPQDVARLPFRLDFSELSPYAAAEIMDLTDPQEERFLKAYDVAKLLLRDLGVFPRRDDAGDERRILDIDEFSDGYPHLKLGTLVDVANAFVARLGKSAFEPSEAIFRGADAQRAVEKRVAAVETTHPVSWIALAGKLHRLRRTGVFDNSAAPPIAYAEMARPGLTTVVDLSDSDSTIINNLVISSLLRGVQQNQEEAYARAEKAGGAPTPVMIVIEEAHEFLSTERIARMRTLYEQVARISRRGRKRWLGLVFVTQLPQHLPDEVLGLINNFVLHRITDVNVVSRLKRSVGGVDEGMWARLPNLAPGQAIVTMTSMTRPLLVAMNPTPCRLRMVE